MIQEFKKVWKPTAIGLVWFFGLLWPLLSIHADGTLTFFKAFKAWSYVAVAECKRRFINLPDRHFASVERLVKKQFMGESLGESSPTAVTET